MTMAWVGALSQAINTYESLTQASYSLKDKSIPAIVSGENKQNSNTDLEAARTNRSNINPLEITFYISSYLCWLLEKNYLQPGIESTFTTALVSLQETMANLDRIRSTPIPSAYQAHLRMTTWFVSAMFLAY